MCGEETAEEAYIIYGFWCARIEADFWWGKRFITPANAAELLSGVNPNIHSDNPPANQLGGSPADYRRLKNTFESLPNRSLAEWVKLARSEHLEINQWVIEWEQCLANIGNKQVTAVRQKRIHDQAAAVLDCLANRCGVDPLALPKYRKGTSKNP